jgi:hypothetical protein
MKTLNRNKQTFYYATYNGQTERMDGNLHTFENIPSYSAWVECRANISPARGESSADVFGADVNYDRVIVTDDLSCPIDEYTVLAIDIAPNTRDTAAVQPIYDYIVTKKAKSLNFIQYAVAKVKVQ